MIKQSITYTDYDGAERTENFYFNLSKEELLNRTNQTRQTETYDLTNCKNCGAPLSRHSCKCEYCGTVYGKIDEQDEECLYADGEVIARVTSAGVITVNEARSLLGLDQSRELDRIASIGLRSEFINRMLRKY